MKKKKILNFTQTQERLIVVVVSRSELLQRITLHLDKKGEVYSYVSVETWTCATILKERN